MRVAGSLAAGSATEQWGSKREGAGNIHISTGDIRQSPARRMIQADMVRMGLHGGDDGHDAASRSNGDFVRIILCESRIKGIIGGA